MKRSTVVEIISSLLILLFVYAAVSKLLDYSTFKLQLAKSPFITDFAGIIAWGVPVTEIIIGLLLSLKKTRLIGLYLSLFLMTAFSSYIFMMLHYSYYIPCSCGGILSKMGWNTHFWFNIAFTIASIAGILTHTNTSKKSKPVIDTNQVVFT